MVQEAGCRTSSKLLRPGREVWGRSGAPGLLHGRLLLGLAELSSPGRPHLGRRLLDDGVCAAVNDQLPATEQSRSSSSSKALGSVSGPSSSTSSTGPAHLTSGPPETLSGELGGCRARVNVRTPCSSWRQTAGTLSSGTWGPDPLPGFPQASACAPLPAPPRPPAGLLAA